jgi:isoleucyl-tRNA synthetase
LDIIKDRLYTSPGKSVARRSAQTAINQILEVLVRLMAPILSFTADEIWQYMKGKEQTPSVHADLFIPLTDTHEDLELMNRWDRIVEIRGEVTKTLELARKEKIIGHSLNASVTLGLSPEFMETLSPYRDQLRSIFIVSDVEITDIGELADTPESDTTPGLKVKVSPSNAPKCDRCWVHDTTVGEDNTHPTICKRCLKVLNEITV